MNFKYCLLLLSMLLAGASARPTSDPPCYSPPWCGPPGPPDLSEPPCYSPPWCGPPGPPGTQNK
uniref:Acp8 n=1 Tax=Drosophila mojavensis TaxID=7230 RepID=Q2VKM3_DROMO|nr:Acp8 [Drosophila mojavensis]